MNSLGSTALLATAFASVLQGLSFPALQPSTLQAQEGPLGAASGQQEMIWSGIRVRAVPIRMRASEQFWETSLAVGPDGLVLRANSGDRMELAASTVTALGYRRQSFRESKVNTGTGFIPLVVPGRGAFGESGAHLITIEFRDGGSRRQGILLEAKKGDYEDILRALARVTRLKVEMRGNDREGFPADFPATVVAEAPSGVLPAVPELPVRWLEAKKEVQSLAFSADGATVATGDADAIRLSRTATGQMVRPPLAVKGGAPDRMVIAPDGDRLVAGSYRALSVWNLATGTNTVQVPIDRRGSGPWSFAISPDGRRAAVPESRDSRRTLRLVDLQTGRAFPAPLATWEVMENPHVAFSADGERLLAWEGGAIRMWRSDSGDLAAEFTAPGAMRVSLSADRTEVLIVGRTQLARLDAATGQVLASATTEWSLAGWVSRDHRLVVTTDWKRGVRLWDGRTLTPIGEPLVGHRGDVVHDVAFDPSGARIATVTAGHAAIWDVLTQRPLGQCITGPLAAFAGWNGPDWSHVWFAPDGRSIGIIRERAESAAVCDTSAIGDSRD